jgi:CDP-6-deoxy-D-xylo-4-hexulose-3-dehydrase
MNAPIHLHKTSPQAIRQQIADLVQQYADIVYEPKPVVPGQTPVPVSGKVLGLACACCSQAT